MRKTEINFKVELDENNNPEKIHWDATDKPDGGLSEAKSISIGLWDHTQKNTLRIDLWTKDMPINEMKAFYVDCLSGFAQTILTATGDEFIANETQSLCDRIANHLKKEAKG